ncbi:MAG: hypothetical protein ACREI3_06650 [Nitrospirales bacterium]
MTGASGTETPGNTERDGRWGRRPDSRCSCRVGAGLAVAALAVGAGGMMWSPHSAYPASDPWADLIAEAKALHLPTGFLELITPGFVRLEFENLKTFAAEYHPPEHRMVLNRKLSFNAAGRVLKPLNTLPHRDLGTLYHELFHAYLDFLRTGPPLLDGQAEAARLLAFARQQQRCRYQVVQITPVLQRKSMTERRILNDEEAWEALNETWAVFVGWTTWTRLEIAGKTGGLWHQAPDAEARWLRRLAEADASAELTGYYEPQTPEERQITHKRFLAPAYRISPAEVGLLLQVLFEDAPALATRSAAAMDQSSLPSADHPACRQPGP